MLHGLSKKHTAAIEELAGQNGFAFEPYFERNELGTHATPNAIKVWDKGENLVKGRLGGLEFQMFDMTKTVSSRDADGHRTRSTSTETVILFENARSLPTMDFRSSKGALSLVNFAGQMGLAFSMEGGFPEEREVVADFNETYYVSGDGFGAGPEPREAPGCVSLDLCRQLHAGRGWCVEVSESHIAMLVSNKLLPAAERLACLEEACDLVALLQSGGSSSSKMMVRELAGVGITMLAKGLLWPFGGAVVGMMGTLLVFGAIFMTLEKPPTWLIFLFPLVGMAMMLGGVLLGLKVGNRRRRGVQA